MESLINISVGGSPASMINDKDFEKSVERRREHHGRVSQRKSLVLIAKSTISLFLLYSTIQSSNYKVNFLLVPLLYYPTHLKTPPRHPFTSRIRIGTAIKQRQSTGQYTILKVKKLMKNNPVQEIFFFLTKLLVPKEDKKPMCPGFVKDNQKTIANPLDYIL